MATNTSLLGHRQPVDEDRIDERVVSIGTDESATLCGRLSSETATAIVEALSDEPKTAADVAEATDTSVQNARYHLNRLRDVGMIRVVDTWYSSKGREMDVYGIVCERVVIELESQPGVEASNVASASTASEPTVHQPATHD
jgi:DNA-binding transcriptional ArsR family regulator